MRKLLLFLVSAIAAHAASFAYVQSASTISANTLAFSSNNTAGNLIVAAVSGFNQGLASGVSDTNGNTYVQYGANPSNTSPGRIQIWVAKGISAGANTLTFTGMSSTNTNIIIAEYTMPSAYSYAVELLPNLAYTGALPFGFPVVVSGSPTMPTEVLLVVVAYDFSNFRSWTISNGTIRQSTHEADGATLVLGDYDVVSPTGAVTTALTATGGGSDSYTGGSIQPLLFGGGGSSNPHAFVFQ